MSADGDDLATLGAIGVLAAMAAALGHEAVGHGGACVIGGGEVTLMSVIWFRCSPGGVVTDIAGPLGGLLVGLGGLALARWGPPRALRTRLFGLLLSTFAVFWFCTQLVGQAISGRDDWAVAVHWPWGWRVAAALAGVAAYGAMVRLAWLSVGRIGRGPRAPRRFLVPYATGALALIACAAFRPSDGSALETALTVGLAPLGYAWAVTRPSLAQGDVSPLARSWPWIVAAAVGLVLYATVFGPGVGRLA